MNPDLIEVLREVDPLRAADRPTANSAAAIALRERTTATPDVRRSPPRWVTIAVATALTIAAIIIVGLVRTDDTAPAYAGWTPTSRAATTDENSAIAAVCNARSADSDGDLPPDAFSADSHIEVRGRIALAIQRSTDRTRYFTCTAELQGSAWYAFGFGSRSAGARPDPSLEGGGGPDNFTSILYGESSLAHSVELDVPGLPTATAPVIDGLYAIWWPAEPALHLDRLPTLQLRLLDAKGNIIDTINW